jgi:alpha-L-fucosidase
MKYKTSAMLLIVSCLSCASGAAQQFEPSWESLHQYKVPEWFKDAKFGIFMHWGGQSVPANDGWYARQMYLQEGAQWGNAYDYHVTHYGHPSLVGYKDLIPLWKAEAWQPDSLVSLYRKIGAKYIVYVAVHHDNIDNYGSSYQHWNSATVGLSRGIHRWRSRRATLLQAQKS